MTVRRVPRVRSALARLMACLSLATVATSRAAAQGVTVSPPVVVIDARTRTGQLDLFNPGREPVEVAVVLRYGIPATDSLGNVFVPLDSAPPANRRAATAWVEAFPRRTTILPGARQTVRFLARPPADLADGEYSTRVVTSSKSAAIPLSVGDSASGISARLNVEVHTVTTLLVRKGAVQTSLELGTPRLSVRNDSLLVQVRAVPGGTAAWLGTLRGSFISEQGRIFDFLERPIGIYEAIEPSFAIARGALPPGRYRLVVTGRVDRLDVPRGLLTPAPEARVETVVEVPGQP